MPNCQNAPFTVRRVGQAGQDVGIGQLREIIQDLLMRHAGGKPAKHVCDCDSHVPNARATAPLARFDGDDALIVHG